MKIRQFLKSAFVVTVSLAIVVALIWVLIKFVGLQASLIWAGAVSAIAWLIRSSVEQKREYQRLLADKKREQYQEFLSFLEHYIVQVKKEKGPQKSKGRNQRNADAVEMTEDEMVAEMRRWSLMLTLIGSDDVLLAYNEARSMAHESPDPEHGLKMMAAWGRLWLAMRKDCGHPDTALKPSDVLASYVNDIGQHKKIVDG